MSPGGIVGPRAATSPGRIMNRGDNNRLSPSLSPSPLGTDEFNHSRPVSHTSAIYNSSSRANSPTLLDLPNGAGLEKSASLQHPNPILSATSIHRTSFRSLNDSDNDNDSIKSTLSIKRFRRGKSAPGLSTPQTPISPSKIRSRSQSPLVNETNATGLAPLLVLDKESFVDMDAPPSSALLISPNGSNKTELLSPLQQSPVPFSLLSEKSLNRSPSSRLPSPSHPLRTSSRNTNSQNISQRDSQDNLLNHGSPPSSPVHSSRVLGIGGTGASFSRGPKGSSLSTKEENAGVGVDDNHAPHIRVRLPDGTPVIFTGSPEPFDLRHGVTPEHNWNATTTTRDISHEHFPLLGTIKHS